MMVAIARLTAKHGSFNCIHQVATICTQSNTWFHLMIRLEWASLTLKWHLGWFSCFYSHVTYTDRHTGKSKSKYVQ